MLEEFPQEQTQETCVSLHRITDGVGSVEDLIEKMRNEFGWGREENKKFLQMCARTEMNCREVAFLGKAQENRRKIANERFQREIAMASASEAGSISSANFHPDEERDAISAFVNDDDEDSVDANMEEIESEREDSVHANMDEREEDREEKKSDDREETIEEREEDREEKKSAFFEFLSLIFSLF